MTSAKSSALNAEISALSASDFFWQSYLCRKCRKEIAESWGFNLVILLWDAESAEAATDSKTNFADNFADT